MALAFTYRLAADQPQGEAKPLQAGPDVLSPAPMAVPLGMEAAPGHSDQDRLTASAPELAAVPDLFDHGAIGTIAASDPATRPESGLGFSCLDLLAGFAESGP